VSGSRRLGCARMHGASRNEDRQCRDGRCATTTVAAVLHFDSR
jgi:hypothetical protein